MNYIWEIILKGKKLGTPLKNVKFRCSKKFSPYMELSLENINEKNMVYDVDINPYYRFNSVFNDLLDVANDDNNGEIKEVLFDIVTHFLAQIDLMSGMHKMEYYIKFIIDDIKNGIFGEEIRESFNYFTEEEKEILGRNVLSLYTINEPIFLLKDSIKKIFRNSIILSNVREKDEVTFYLGEEETEANINKLKVLKKFFMPFKFNIEVYYVDIFGIIGIDDMMKIDKMLVY